MDLHYKQEVTVGGLVILALILFYLGTQWLGGRSLERIHTLQVQYTDIGNLKVGSPVHVSGVAVGKVVAITLEEVDRVLVTFTVSRKVAPRLDAQATIVSIGFLGDVALDFDPGDSPLLLPSDRVLIGKEAEGFATRAGSLADQASQVMLGAQEVLNKQTAQDLREMLRSMTKLLNLLANTQSGPTAQATEALAAITRLSNRLDATLSDPGLKRAITHLDSLAQNGSQMTAQITTTSARLDSLLLAINRGQGSLGKFATDTGLYTDVRKTSQALKALLDTIAKNPGKLTVQVKIF